MLMKMFFGSIIFIALAVLGAGIFRNTQASTTEIGAEVQSNEDNQNNILEPYIEDGQLAGRHYRTKYSDRPSTVEE